MQEAKKQHDGLTQDIDALAHHLSAVSGMHVGIHDPDRTTMISGGDSVNNLCKFCSARSTLFSEHCRCDDRNFLKRALTEQQPITYRCHLGLTEAILPIIDEDAVVGVLFLGQVRITPDHTMTDDAVYARLHDMDPDAFGEDIRESLTEAYRGTCSMSKEQFRSFCSLADYAARGVYVSNWLSAVQEPPNSTCSNICRHASIPYTFPCPSFPLRRSLRIFISHILSSTVCRAAASVSR